MGAVSCARTTSRCEGVMSTDNMHSDAASAQATAYATQSLRLSSLPTVVTDEVFDLMGAFREDQFTSKVNLGAGVYRTDEGTPWLLPVVEKVEKHLLSTDDVMRHEYLAIAGDVEFLDAARDLALGFDAEKESELQKQHKLRVASVQTVSGTGANHIGAAFLAEHVKPKHVWISDPTWINHHTIWDLTGIHRKQYPYYNAADGTFNFDGMMQTLEKEAEPNDVIVLHSCAHNPTGLDPSEEQWKAICELCHRKRLFPFFDSAYQGFASGDPNKDAWPIQYFFHHMPAMELCIAQSFSKNFGLYGQRTGAFHLITSGANLTMRNSVVDNLSHLIRGEYSMAPRYGSTIVKTILRDKALNQEWRKDLIVMSNRIKEMRSALYNELKRLGTPGSWSHILNQV